MLLYTSIIFAVLIILRFPIAFVLGGSSLFYILGTDIPIIVIAQRVFNGANSFLLIAVPLFFLAGNLMNHGGITKRIINLADEMVGRMRGGLAHVDIVACMFFAGITGSATADCAAIGSIMIPSMVDSGYDKDFSAGVTAAASIMGPIIPPSIPFIFYAMASSTSIGMLLLSGVVPGVLLGLSMMVVSYILAKKRGYPKKLGPFVWRKFWKAFIEATPALLTPLIIVGGIISGVFTATESAAIATVYALIVGMFFYQELKPSALARIFYETARMTAAVVLLLSMAMVFGWILTAERVPQIIGGMLMNSVHSTWSFLLVVNIFLLFVGCVMETITSIIILTPILIPIATSYGIDPIHFGLIMVLNLCIGMCTPPVGVCLYVASGIARISLERITMAVGWYLLASIIVLFIATYWSPLALFLPNLLMK